MATVAGGASPLPGQETSGLLLGQVTHKQQVAEAHLAVREMWGVLTPIREVGAVVNFTYWVNQGALTMVAWERTARGGVPGSAARSDTFVRKLDDLSTLVQGRPRFLHVTVRREANGWAAPELHFEDAPVDAVPPEAKTLPVDVAEIPSGSFRELEREAGSRWVKLLRVPEDGAASQELTVDFEDERLVRSSPGRREAVGRGVLIEALPGFETELANALEPFTQGLGRRSVRVVLHATRVPGDPHPRWRVERVATLRPEKPEPNEPFTTAAEYRQLHEEIIRGWREGTAQAAVMVGSFAAEQLAVWIAGGWMARGAGTLLEVASGPLVQVLGRGSEEAAGWLYCLLRRLPEAEKEELVELWMKAEAQGFNALESTERARLRAGLERLGKLAEMPLTIDEKDTYREIARKRLWAYLRRLDPSLPDRLIDLKGKLYEVHHRIGLEYAYLFPEMDVNAIFNLAAIKSEVHYSISRIWTAFRASRAQVSPARIRDIAAIIDRNYGRWYNSVYNSVQHSAQLQIAERTALAEIQALLAR